MDETDAELKILKTLYEAIVGCDEKDVRRWIRAAMTLADFDPDNL